MNKDEILEEIRQRAKNNNGTPLGEKKFTKETRISRYEWSKYWARFSEAQIEAGFNPNLRTGAYDDESLFLGLINLIRKYKRFPILGELKLETHQNPDFPSMSPYRRLGGKEQWIKGTIEFCAGKPEYEDVLKLCPQIPVSPNKSNSVANNIGEVYLFKSGRYYKIGKTNDTVRRGKELRIQLPVKPLLIHSIKTDDPSGIEAYWHKRFEAKRKEGEWFNLNAEDIKAFQRWKKIV